MLKLHFIGIGGIGMSALAAMCADHPEQYSVTGSDRGAHKSENQRIIGPLQKQGITIFEQDGSFARTVKPDFLVYSTAIEDDNPDFLAAPGIPHLHRSELLKMLLENGHFTNTVAVTGSCGKSSVCAYCAETLLNLGENPNALDGALVKRFRTEKFAGNYRSGDGRFLVFEADESDKSLLNYSADYAIILNIGTDHYDKAELARVFAEFINHLHKGAVIEREAFEAVKPMLKTSIPIAVFSAQKTGDARYFVSDYAIRDRKVCARFNGQYDLQLPQSGFHNAMNALAIFALMEMLHFPAGKILPALERFDGVWRRNDYAGKTAGGAAVFDDYAHNPEKIAGCLKAARDLYAGKICAVFQPHGYKPFGFMREELFAQIDPILQDGDRFILLEPYYAGGTSSFRPSSQEVADSWREKAAHPERYLNLHDRAGLRDFLLRYTASGDVIVIMGARDNSLSDYAVSLTTSAPGKR